MTLGDILKQAAIKDLAGKNKNQLVYTEQVVDDKFEIRLTSLTHKDAFIECSIPDKNIEDESFNNNDENIINNNQDLK